MKLNKKGQSMVETAIVLPILLFLLMAIIEFGRIFGSYLLINYSSRESARLASVGKSDAEIVQNVMDKSGLLDVSNIQVIIDPDESSRRTGDEVNVEIIYKLTIYAPIIQSIIPNPYEMEASTYMRVE